MHTYQGDSGGPLACPASDEKWYLHGITSFSGDLFGRCNSGNPDFFTNVTMFLDWIDGARKKLESFSGNNIDKAFVDTIVCFFQLGRADRFAYELVCLLGCT